MFQKNIVKTTSRRKCKFLNGVAWRIYCFYNHVYYTKKKYIYQFFFLSKIHLLLDVFNAKRFLGVNYFWNVCRIYNSRGSLIRWAPDWLKNVGNKRFGWSLRFEQDWWLWFKIDQYCNTTSCFIGLARDNQINKPRLNRTTHTHRTKQFDRFCVIITT